MTSLQGIRINRMAILLISILIINNAHSSEASIISFYSFNDEIPQDWWITNGDAIVEEGYLMATECLDPLSNGFCTVALWLNSTLAIGSWTMDYYRSNLSNDFLFYFMAEGVSEISNNHWPENANVLFILGEDVAFETNIAFGNFLEGDGGVVNDQVNIYSDLVGIGWLNIIITRTSEGILNVFLDDQIIGSVYSEISSSQHINLQIGVGDRIDNFTIYNEVIKEANFTISNNDNVDLKTGSPNNEDQTLHLLQYIIGGIGTIFGFYYLGKFYYRKKYIKRMIKSIINKQVLVGSSIEFNLSDEIILTLLGNLRTSSDPNDIDYNIPSELLQYRYLMHPIRLSILKILYIEDKMLVNEIRETLAVNSNEFRNHIVSLNNKGYLKILENFNKDGNVIRVALIEDLGRQEFKLLFSLLENFTKTGSPYSNILNSKISNLNLLFPTD